MDNVIIAKTLAHAFKVKFSCFRAYPMDGGIYVEYPTGFTEVLSLEEVADALGLAPADRDEDTFAA